MKILKQSFTGIFHTAQIPIIVIYYKFLNCFIECSEKNAVTDGFHFNLIIFHTMFFLINNFQNHMTTVNLTQNKIYHQ